MVILTCFCSHVEYGFTYRESMLFWGMGMEFKDKMMLRCFREVKDKQAGFHYRDLILVI